MKPDLTKLPAFMIKIVKTSGINEAPTALAIEYRDRLKSDGLYKMRDRVQLSLNEKQMKSNKLNYTKERLTQAHTTLKNMADKHGFNLTDKNIEVFAPTTWEEIQEEFDTRPERKKHKKKEVDPNRAVDELLIEKFGNKLMFSSMIRRLLKEYGIERVIQMKDVFASEIAVAEKAHLKEMQKEQEKKQKATELLRQMNELGITPDYIADVSKTVKKADIVAKVKPKTKIYRLKGTHAPIDWDGNGRMPAALADDMKATGKRLEDYLI